jgi:hypothetical protein
LRHLWCLIHVGRLLVKENLVCIGRKLLNIVGDSLIIALVPVLLLVTIEHDRLRGKSESINFEAIEHDVDVIGWLVKGLTALFAGFFSFNVIVQRLIRAFS